MIIGLHVNNAAICPVANVHLVAGAHFECALQLVIQLAKAKGIHTCNVVQDRPNMHELEHYVKGL